MQISMNTSHLEEQLLVKLIYSVYFSILISVCTFPNHLLDHSIAQEVSAEATSRWVTSAGKSGGCDIFKSQVVR